MKEFTKKLIYFSLSSTILLINGCSSHSEVISVSQPHLYNENFGVHQNYQVDRIIRNEILAINAPTQIDYPHDMSSQWTTKLTFEPNTFLEEDYVPTEPTISYKYKFDKKFYKTAEWRKANF